MNFCVYLHVHHDVGYPIIFYVGKGSRKRSTLRQSRNVLWKRIVAKHGFETIIHRDNLSEAEAHRIERDLIRSIGRRDLGTGPLCNFTEGGEGSSGRQLSEESRKKMSIAKRGKKLSDAHRAKLKHLRSDPAYRQKLSVIKRSDPESRSRAIDALKKARSARSPFHRPETIEKMKKSSKERTRINGRFAKES